MQAVYLQCTLGEVAQDNRLLSSGRETCGREVQVPTEAFPCSTSLFPSPEDKESEFESLDTT